MRCVQPNCRSCTQVCAALLRAKFDNVFREREKERERENEMVEKVLRNVRRMMVDVEWFGSNSHFDWRKESLKRSSPSS